MLSFRKFSSKILKKTGLLCLDLSRRVYRSPQEEIEEAFNKNVYETYWLDHDLDENSLVLDVGGYRGQWASDIFAAYRCYIHVLEPIVRSAEVIERRFLRNNKVVVHRFGLSSKTMRSPISVEGNKSSIFKHGKENQEIELVRASDFLEQSGFVSIDLMKVNIEGGEYDLLEDLLDEGLIDRIRSILVQFHEFVPHAEERMRDIQTRLALTHSPAYQYRFVWEKWTLRKH